MTVYISIYVAKDTHGNTYSAVVDDPSDTIQLCGMKDERGEWAKSFESEAWHANDWAAKNGLGLTVHALKVDLASRGVKAWETSRLVTLPLYRVYVRRKDLDAARYVLWNSGLQSLDERPSDEPKFGAYFVLNRRLANELVLGMARDGLTTLMRDHA